MAKAAKRREAAIWAAGLADLLDHEAEAVPRVGVGESFVDDGAAGARLVGEGLGSQLLLGREVPVEGGEADASAPGLAVIDIPEPAPADPSSAGRSKFPAPSWHDRRADGQ